MSGFGPLVIMTLACGSPQTWADAADDVRAQLSLKESSTDKESPLVVNKISRRSAPRIVQNTGGAEFRPVSVMELRVKVGNGVVSDTALWPATVAAKVYTGICTATLVGPEALLTAKHCVGNGKIVKIKFQDGETFEGPCTHPKDGHLSADWALCRMKPAVVRPGLFYEFISVNPSRIRKGIILTVGGYGCTRIPIPHRIEEEQESPTFRTGQVFVNELPGQKWPNWILTNSARQDGSAFICPGDSGGAAYLVEPSGRREVVAVASAIGDEETKDDYLVSYLAALTTSSAQEFLSQWLKDNVGAKICGLGENPEKCRPSLSFNITPPPDDYWGPKPP